MKRVILTFGVISGLIVSTLMASTISFQKEMSWKGMAIGFTTMLLAFSFIFFAIQSYKKANGGIITFKQSFLTGLGVAAVCSVFYVITWMIVYYNFMPNFMQDYSAHHIESMRKSGATDKEIQDAMKEMAKSQELYKNPINVALITLLEIFPLGVVVTLIAAFIEKYKSNKAQNATA